MAVATQQLVVTQNGVPVVPTTVDGQCVLALTDLFLNSAVLNGDGDIVLTMNNATSYLLELSSLYTQDLRLPVVPIAFPGDAALGQVNELDTSLGPVNWLVPSAAGYIEGQLLLYRRNGANDLTLIPQMGETINGGIGLLADTDETVIWLSRTGATGWTAVADYRIGGGTADPFLLPSNNVAATDPFPYLNEALPEYVNLVTGGPGGINLPDPTVLPPGTLMVIKKATGALIELDASPVSIDGSSTYAMSGPSGESILLASFATGWRIISDYAASAAPSPSIFTLEANWALHGATTATIPGDPRGDRAIDIQGYRTVATQVASGEGAVIVGNQNTASGDFSIVVGGGSTALGLRSIAIGDLCNAPFDYGCVLGYYSSVSGPSGCAIGTASTAGENSSAFGTNSTASPLNCSAFGFNANAVAAGTIAHGNAASASGVDSISFGNNSSSLNDRGISFGTLSNSGRDTISFGWNSQIAGNECTFIGNSPNSPNTSSSNSSGFGYGLTLGKNSPNVAMLGHSISVGDYCSNCVAVGGYVVSIGNNSFNSTAVGNQVSISGSYSALVVGASSSITDGPLSAIFGPSSQIVSGSYCTTIGNSNTINPSVGSIVASQLFGSNNVAQHSLSVLIGNYQSDYGHSTGYVSIGYNSGPNEKFEFYDGVLRVPGLQINGSLKENVTTASTGVNYTVDLSLGTVWTITLTASITISFSNLLAGRSCTINLIQGGAGSHTVAWSGVTWPNGTPPVLSTVAGRRDKLVFDSYNGVVVDGSLAGIYYS